MEFNVSQLNYLINNYEYNIRICMTNIDYYEKCLSTLDDSMLYMKPFYEDKIKALKVEIDVLTEGINSLKNHFYER